MESNFRINGQYIDGVAILEKSIQSWLQWPSLNDVETNDWAEYDGIEADLQEPTLDSRNIKLNFYAKNEERYQSFVDMLTSSFTTFTLSFDIPNSENGVAYSLDYSVRLSDTDLTEYNEDFQTFSATFIHDNTAECCRNEAPILQSMPPSEISIDGIDIRKYGLHILEGSYSSLFKKGAIKEKLLIKSAGTHGAVYDNIGSNKFQSYDATIKLLMRGRNAGELLENYSALLHLLIQPFERRLNIGEVDFYFYYKSSSCESFCDKLSSGYAGIEFNVTICIVAVSKFNGVYLVSDRQPSVFLMNGYNRLTNNY